MHTLGIARVDNIITITVNDPRWVDRLTDIGKHADVPGLDKVTQWLKTDVGLDKLAGWDGRRAQGKYVITATVYPD